MQGKNPRNENIKMKRFYILETSVLNTVTNKQTSRITKVSRDKQELLEHVYNVGESLSIDGGLLSLETDTYTVDGKTEHTSIFTTKYHELTTLIREQYRGEDISEYE